MPRRSIFSFALSMALVCFSAFPSLEAQQAPPLPPAATEREKATRLAPPMPAAPEATSQGEAKHQPDAAEVQRHRSQKLSESEQTELIRELQVLLKGHNCYGGEINGLREDTRAAITELRRHQAATQAVDLAEMTIGNAVDLLDWLERQPRPLCPPVSGGKEQHRPELEQARQDAERARDEQRRREEDVEQARLARERLRREEEMRRLEQQRREAREAAERMRLEQEEHRRDAEESRLRRQQAARGEGGVSFDRRYSRSGGGGGGGGGAGGSSGGAIMVPSF